MDTTFLNNGLTRHSVLLSTEDPDAYRKHCKVFFDRFAHRDEIQQMLVQQLADLQWRLLRIPGMEAALLESGDLKSLSVISMHEQRLLRAFDKTLAILGNLQATQCKKDPKNGFVYTAPRTLFCDNCATENEKTTICDHCGSRNLVTEAEYDRRHPSTFETTGNSVPDELWPAA